MYDILIKNAKIADGSGNPTFFADVAVKDGKIARICKNLKAEAQTVIDGKGKVLSPGFIDVHSHHDLELEKNFLCSNSLEQGITTIIGGMCGDSPVPFTQEHFSDCLRSIGGTYSEESLRCRTSLADYRRRYTAVATIAAAMSVKQDEVTAGFDRVCALFGGQETIRDYIAFPKNNQGRDVMIDSPSYIDQEQMDELFLNSTAERKE